MLNPDFKELLRLFNSKEVEYRSSEDMQWPLMAIPAIPVTKSEQVIQLGFAPAQIDILTDIDGVSFRDCWARKVMLDFFSSSNPGSLQAAVFARR